MIYFIQLSKDDSIKIGSTKNLPNRMASHRSTFGCELLMLGVCDGGRSEEAAIHRQFREWRIYERGEGPIEVYEPAMPILNFIESRCRMPDMLDQLHENHMDKPPRHMIVKADVRKQLVAYAKMLAKERGVSLYHYLDEILSDSIETEYMQFLRELNKTIETPV